MGFTIPERRSAKLTFETVPGWEKAEARVLIDAPLSVVLYIEESATDDSVSSRDLFTVVADEILMSWNLEDAEGNAIPSTIDGMMQVPRAFMTMLMTAYYRAASQVPESLDEPLQNGKLSRADSMLVLASQSESLPPSETQD